MADVSNPDGIKMLFTKTMEIFETVDILVNNAGICTPKPFLELTVDDINTVFSVNIVGVVLCTQAAAKIMIPRETGRIINIASISCIGNFGTAGNMPYAMSKAAVVNATGIMPSTVVTTYADRLYHHWVVSFEPESKNVLGFTVRDQEYRRKPSDRRPVLTGTMILEREVLAYTDRDVSIDFAGLVQPLVDASKLRIYIS